MAAILKISLLTILFFYSSIQKLFPDILNGKFFTKLFCDSNTKFTALFASYFFERQLSINQSSTFVSKVFLIDFFIHFKIQLFRKIALKMSF